MSYVTPVKDRVLSDVTTPTAKGYLNVADFVRIYGNARLTSALASIELGTSIAFTFVSAPTTTTTEGIYTMLNTLLSSVETLRLAMVALIPTLTEVKDDWTPGPNEDAPDYTDANLWETTIDAIWDYYSGDNLVVCPTLTENLTILTGETVVYVDCLETDGYDIDIQGTGALHII